MKYIIVFPDPLNTLYRRSCDVMLASKQNNQDGFDSLKEIHDAVAAHFTNARYITPYRSLLHFEQRNWKVEIFVINSEDGIPKTRKYEIIRSDPKSQHLNGAAMDLFHYPIIEEHYPLGQAGEVFHLK